MDLKKLIGEENFKKLELSDAQKKAVEDAALFDPKEHVPKKEFNEKNEAYKNLSTEKESLDKKVNALTTELQTLKDEKASGSKTVEERMAKLEADLAKAKEDATKFQTDLESEKKKGILRSHLTEAKANPKYLSDLEGKFKLEDLKFENGKIVGFDELLKPVKENYNIMFGEVKLGGDPPPTGGNNKPDDIFTVEQIRGMSTTERVQNIDKINKSMTYHNANN